MLSYDDNTIKMLSLLLTLCDELSDAFVIMQGLINYYPRTFTVEQSILQADCNSLMRYELLVFKSLV